jgi:paraquat-inducible protein A
MASIILCPACDLVQRPAPPPQTARVRCARCRALLPRHQQARLDWAMALTVCALVFFVLGNTYPLVIVNMNGVNREATLVDAALGLSQQGFWVLCWLVLLTTVLAPLLQIGALLYLLAMLYFGRMAPGQRVIFRILTVVRSWTFVEVFMLGAVVALVRLAAFARVLPGIALVCCGLLMMTLAALSNMTSPSQFWRWVERRT